MNKPELTPEACAAYLERIDAKKEVAADIDTLRHLHFSHATRIPFENINALLGLPVRLDSSSLIKKLVFEKRGGYCFEQNLLMAAVLETAGFTVVKLAARPLWHYPAGALPEPLVTGLPRSHMLLLVTPEQEGEKQRWLVDVGFGGYTPLGPVALEPYLEQQVVHDTFRVITHEQGYILQALVRAQWKALYVFDLQPQQLADLEMMNYWVSTSAESRFTQQLVCTMPHAHGRHAFMNTALASYDWQGNERKTLFRDAEEILQLLENTFTLDLSGDGNLKERIRQLLSAEGS